MTPEISDPETFDLSVFRVKNPEIQETVINESSTEPQEPFDLSAFKVKESPTKFQEFQRHVSRTGARVAETVAGFPGDFIKFSQYIGESLPKVPSFLERKPSFVQKAGKKALEYVPTSSELKDFSSYLTSGFTDPKSAGEELGDEITQLATILIQPSKAATGFSSLLKNIGTSVAKSAAVKGAGKGAELFGADESTKSKVELGTLFLTGMFGKKTADKFVGEQYQEARSKIPKGDMINTQSLAHRLDAVDKELSKGLSTATKDEVRKSLSELKAKASGGAMEVDEVVQSLHDINERMNSKKLFDDLSSSERKLLKSRYDKFKGEVHNTISDYGRKNPEFYKQWSEANQAYGTIAQSKKFSNFLESKLGKIPNHLIGSVVIDLFLGHPLLSVGAVGSYGLVKTGELMARIAKSPKLREHYIRVIMEAQNENLPAVIKNMEAIDKDLKNQ